MYSKIILPLDGSGHAECALPHAEALAKGLGVKLVLLQIIPYPEVRDAGVESDWAVGARKYLGDIAGGLKNRGVKDVDIDVVWGEVQKVIVEYAQGDDSLIVMSTHGRTGLAKLAFGSVTEAVLRSGTVTPVMVCRCFAGGADR